MSQGPSQYPAFLSPAPHLHDLSFKSFFVTYRLCRAIYCRLVLAVCNQQEFSLVVFVPVPDLHLQLRQDARVGEQTRGERLYSTRRNH